MQQKVHFIGVGGIGMSALAGVLLERKAIISGSDAKASGITGKLENMGMTFFQGHHKSHLPADTEEVVISSAIGQDNPELQEALQRGIPVIKRAEMLARIMAGKDAICIAGAHGKTTTTGMLACVMEEAGMDPSVVVGGILPNIQGNYRIGSGRFFIAEADESDKSFLLYSPFASIITNIEDDHMENYGSMDKIIDAFELFIAGNQQKHLVTFCLDSPSVAEMYQKIQEGLTYSLDSERAQYYCRNIGYEKLGIGGDLYGPAGFLGRLQLQIPGRHNLQNAIGVSALSLALGVEFSSIARAMERFYGVERRFQILFRENHYYIVDDYAHHPSEIQATLKGAREAHPGKILVVFQPHRYSRTRQFLKEFSESFTDADQVLLLPIYSASEAVTGGIASEDIIALMKKPDKEKTIYCQGFAEAEKWLMENKGPSDLVITMGAGDVHLVGENLAKKMRDQIAYGE